MNMEEPEILLLHEPHFTKHGFIQDSEWIPIYNGKRNARGLIYIRNKPDFVPSTTEIIYLKRRDFEIVYINDTVLRYTYHQPKAVDFIIFFIDVAQVKFSIKYPGPPAFDKRKDFVKGQMQNHIFAGDFNFHHMEWDLYTESDRKREEMVHWLHEDEMNPASPDVTTTHEEFTKKEYTCYTIDIRNANWKEFLKDITQNINEKISIKNTPNPLAK